MEQLQRNKRKSALWLSMGFIIWVSALCISFNVATHKLYDKPDITSIDQFKGKVEKDMDVFKKKRAALRAMEKDLKDEIAACKENDPQKYLDRCEQALEEVEDDLSNLKEEIQMCNMELRILTSGNN